LFSMSSTDSLYLVFLTTGLTVGFGHCIGMCGPIVVSLSLNLGGKRTLVPHLLYNGGRVTTYAILGGLMGLTGSFTAVASRIAGLQKGVMIFSGILIIAMALAMSGWIPLGGIFGNGSTPQSFISRGFRRLTRSTSRVIYYPIGLLLGLLPCGPVYTALLAAAGTGIDAGAASAGFLRGLGLMTAFGLGTVPALLVIGRLAGSGWLRARAILYRTGAILMLGVGVYFVIRGIQY
jgi:sulfite exporter TauE/SafE